MKIKDPTKEFLFVMDIYLDKTGKSAGITSSCGEPVIRTMEIPDVNWKDAPKFDMNRLHVPEILRGDGQGGTALPDIESHSDDEVDDVDEDIDEDYNDVDNGYVDNKTAKKNKKRTKRLSHCLAATHNLLVSYRTYLCFMLGTSVGPHQKRMIFRRFSYVFKS
jgi:hypothetical protein